jgi:hypothetical protein
MPILTRLSGAHLKPCIVPPLPKPNFAALHPAASAATPLHAVPLRNSRLFINSHSAIILTALQPRSLKSKSVHPGKPSARTAEICLANRPASFPSSGQQERPIPGNTGTLPVSFFCVRMELVKIDTDDE